MTTAAERCPWCGSSITRSEFERISESIREDEERKRKEQVKAIETQYSQILDRERKQAAQAAAEAEKRNAEELIDNLKSANSTLLAANSKLKQDVEHEAEAERQRQLKEQREILTRDHERQLLVKEAEFSRQLDSLQKKFDEVDRQLKKRTSGDLGDGAEIDLFESLRAEFPDDKITRVPKGEAGADIHQQVIYKGRTCGLIIYDAKNRKAWQRTFVTKLHDDQVEVKADHAILATRVFPSQKKELCIEDDVIVVNPSRAVHIVRILRGSLIRLQLLGLSQSEKAEKMQKLYRFINSEEYTLRFSQAGRLADQISELDAQEQNEHRNIWKKRGLATTKLKNVLNEIDTEISSIVEGVHGMSAACPSQANR